MNESLTRRFAAENALAPTSDPLIRLGALYHLIRKGSTKDTDAKIEALLGPAEQACRDETEELFRLHAAIGLAQRGHMGGIRWLFQFLRQAQTLRQQELGLTALRNCSQFPFALILGNVVSPAHFEKLHERVGEVLAWSDDVMWGLAEDRQQGERLLRDIEGQLAGLSQYFPADKALSFGTVLCEPLFEGGGFRYSGFIGVERERQPLCVPFTMSEVINTDSGAARCSARGMIRLGRRVCLAHRLDGHQEALVIYAIPLEPPSPRAAKALLGRLALGSDGCDIAVLVHQFERRSKKGEQIIKREMSRLVTARGRTWAVQSRQEDRPGLCTFVHPANEDRPFRDRRSILSEEETAQVLVAFLEAATLEKATLVKKRNHGYTLATKGGEVIDRGGVPPAGPVVFMETTAKGRFPVELPGSFGTAKDRAQILTSFFRARPEQLGIVISVVHSRALVVNPPNGDNTFWDPRDQTGVTVGTPALWERLADGKLVIRFVSDMKVAAACPDCQDTGKVLCRDCEGTCRRECEECDGSGKTRCGNCTDGRRYCEKCEGSGKTRCGNCTDGRSNCGKCEGSGHCRTCGGRGRYADSGRLCKKCGGAGRCDRCGGAGSYTCRTCGGTGLWSCDRCHGAGSDTCRTCGGTGLWSCDRCHGSGEVQCSPVCDCACGGRATFQLVPI